MLASQIIPHQKYYLGQWWLSIWLLSGIELSECCYLEELSDRSWKTVLPIIEWVSPGYWIISNGWSFSANISNISNGIYILTMIPISHICTLSLLRTHCCFILHQSVLNKLSVHQLAVFAVIQEWVSIAAKSWEK